MKSNGENLAEVKQPHVEDRIPMSDLHPFLQLRLYHWLARLSSFDVRNTSKSLDEIGMTLTGYIEDWGAWCPLAAFWRAVQHPYCHDG